MRSIVRRSGFSVQTISGTRAVLFGINAEREATRKLLGFAIGERIEEEDTIRWLRGYKFFKQVVEDPQPGERRSTLEHPIQSFLWGHYEARPGALHHYVIRPVFKPEDGDLTQLVHGDDLNISIETESEDGGRHSIIFNRGAIVSQAYADRFGDIEMTRDERLDMLNDSTAAETQWLSRGLLEAAIGFIGQANSPRFSLCCGFYELTYKPILDALVRAARQGAKVYVVYETGHFMVRDQVFKVTDTGADNAEAVAPYLAIPNLTFVPRTHFISLTHNKFMVLLENDLPAQVWTGSTNITPSGFTGQSNCGHIVRDAEIAKKYHEYWEILAKDERRDAFKTFNMAHTPRPNGDLPQNSLNAFFSPRRGHNMLDWYGEQLLAAEQTMMLTSAFGVTPDLAEYITQDRDFLRFILMEQRSRGAGVQERLEADKELRIVLGQPLGSTRLSRPIDGWALDDWYRREEHFRGNQGFVFYVHTKYMLIDPLTDDPKVFTGSANFSPPSLTSNDENMLLIRGDKRVADVYLTEFVRLFNHFYFRQVANRNARRRMNNLEAALYLDDTDNWVSGHYRSQNYRSKRRELFGTTPN